MATTQIHGTRQIKTGTINDTIVDASIIVADGANAFTADQSLGGFKLTNLGAPSGDNDAARKVDVDAARAGLLIKDPVRVATTADITLSGTQTIDGVALSAGNRVLVKDQAAPEDNGIYVVAAGAWARSTDADASAEVKAGLAVWVNEGTANGDKRFVLTTDDPITLGTTELVFTQDSAGTTYTFGNGLAISGTAVSITPADTSLTAGADDLAVNLNTTGGLETSTGVRVKLDGSTLARGADGMKVADAGITETQLATSVAGAALTGGGGTALAVQVAAAGGIQITSDALEIKLDGTSLLLSSSGIKVNAAKWVNKETPSGTVNGTNDTFTLAATPIAGSDHVYLNGLLQEAGGEDYTITTNSIVFVTAPLTGSRIRVSYMVA